jgi:hypothetical protein
MMLPQGLTYNTHLPTWLSKTCPNQQTKRVKEKQASKMTES